MPKPFKGEINLDIRNSTPDWEAFLSEKAPGARRTSSSSCVTTPASTRSPFGGRIDLQPGGRARTRLGV